MRGIFWLAEDLLASQEVFAPCGEWVSGTCTRAARTCHEHLPYVSGCRSCFLKSPQPLYPVLINAHSSVPKKTRSSYSLVQSRHRPVIFQYEETHFRAGHVSKTHEFICCYVRSVHQDKFSSGGHQKGLQHSALVPDNELCKLKPFGLTWFIRLQWWFRFKGDGCVYTRHEDTWVSWGVVAQGCYRPGCSGFVSKWHRCRW